MIFKSLLCHKAVLYHKALIPHILFAWHDMTQSLSNPFSTKINFIGFFMVLCQKKENKSFSIYFLFQKRRRLSPVLRKWHVFRLRPHFKYFTILFSLSCNTKVFLSYVSTVIKKNNFFVWNSTKFSSWMTNKTKIISNNDKVFLHRRSFK